MATTSRSWPLSSRPPHVSAAMFIPMSCHCLNTLIYTGGNISLASANAFDAPIINPALLATPLDIAIMREAVKAARKYVATPGFANYVISEFGDFAKAQTDDEIDAFIRDQSDTVDHPVGTVAMGNGQEGALDANLRVKGTKGLRVVDASAFVSSHS